MERALAAERAAPALLDLREHPLGRTRSFRCPDELPLPYAPADCAAADHYDLYGYTAASDATRL